MDLVHLITHMNKLKLITEGQTNAFCFVTIAPLRAAAKDSSEMISQLLFGEPVEIVAFGFPWIKIRTLLDGYEGFADIKHLLAISSKETKRWLDEKEYLCSPQTVLLGPKGKQILSKGSLVGYSDFNIGQYNFQLTLTNESTKSIWQHALDYLNSPYLWGGKSIFGIDCSGFIQVIYRLFGVNLPRDAYQQEEFGVAIDYLDVQPNDLAFFANETGRIIHVGIVGTEKKIIHASGRVRVDQLTQKGIWNEDYEIITHQLHSIKRMI